MPYEDYSYDRGEEIHSCGAFVSKHETRDLAGGLFEIDSVLWFGREGEGMLDVHEILEELPSGRVHRLQYSYHFEYRTQFHFRYDRDPDNHPEMPEHKHVPPEETRIESDSVRFQDVLDELNTIIYEIEVGEAGSV